MSKDDPPEQQKTTFTQFLLKQANGGVHTELTEQLAECANSVIEQEKSASITLTINMQPGRADGVVEARCKVVSKPAKASEPTTMWWPDEKGNLHRSDPNQYQIPDTVRAVPSQDGDVKHVDVETGEVKELATT